MPLLLDDADIDVEAEAIDLTLSDAEEGLASALAARDDNEYAGDLSDGGMVGGATLYPMVNGQRQQKGRAVARRAWMWDGTPTVLTLAWNPDGNRHDGGRHYLSKKHCLCCNESGFRTHCRKCRDNNCGKCRGATVPNQIIPCFYLQKDDVPFQYKFYGEIDCFLTSCIRRGSRGFQTEEDMRMHAGSRHTKQYEAFQAVQQANQTSQVEKLETLVNTLMAAQLQNGAEPSTPRTRTVKTPRGKRSRTPEKVQADKDRMVKARAGRGHSPPDNNLSAKT